MSIENNKPAIGINISTFGKPIFKLALPHPYYHLPYVCLSSRKMASQCRVRVCSLSKKTAMRSSSLLEYELHSLHHPWPHEVGLFRPSIPQDPHNVPTSTQLEWKWTKWKAKIWSFESCVPLLLELGNKNPGITSLLKNSGIEKKAEKLENDDSRVGTWKILQIL